MGKFTPGPWKIWEGPSYVGGGADLCIGAGETWLFNMDHRNCVNRIEHNKPTKCAVEEDTDIASCEWQDVITMEQRANARLIAAAPELYEGLKSVVETMRKCQVQYPPTTFVYDELEVICNQALAIIAKAEGEET